MKKLLTVTLIGAGLLVFGVQACDSEPEKSKNISSEEVLEKTREAIELSKDFLLQEKDAFEEKAMERLEKIREKIERLKNAAKEAEHGAKEIQVQLDELENREKELKENLDAIRSETALDELKTGFEDAMKKIEKWEIGFKDKKLPNE
jgi:septal ring factor EnvC (AmiA/AmiB activator)